jgi:hypothetical protein
MKDELCPMRVCGARMSQLFAVRAIPKKAAISLAATCPADIGLNDERREVLETVMGVLAGERPDPEELAACSYLLVQLSRAIGA